METFTRWSKARLDILRLRLANPEAMLLLSIMAVCTGLLTGLIIVFFRFTIDVAQSFLLPNGKVDGFESLPPEMLFAFPVIGAVLLSVFFQFLKPSDYRVGVLHVIERLNGFHAYLPGRNMIAQFVGACIAIISGHSVGREGPCVHMGAYGGSWISQRLQLPHNSSRTLVACGTAAAIGASFNTPLAGIIFAMEVVLQSYTVQGFIPVIVAAISGTYLSLFVMGEELFFDISINASSSIIDWPLIIFFGICIGLASALFNVALVSITRLSSKWWLWLRFILAGVIMGGIGLWQPESMGLGYDTAAEVLSGSIGVKFLLLILAAKFCATLICVGLGIPGGVIGPLMFLGALAGGVLATMLYSSGISWLIPNEPILYPLLGMGAMFAASLQAPLAGLTAIVELAGTTEVILPAMLAIVSASLTNKVLFQHDSLFATLLQARGLESTPSPFQQRISMIGAASVMSRSFVEVQSNLSVSVLRRYLNSQVLWFLFSPERSEHKVLMSAIELQNLLEGRQEDEVLDVNQFGVAGLVTIQGSVLANLQEAIESLDTSEAKALYLCGAKTDSVYGVLTRDQIDKAVM